MEIVQMYLAEAKRIYIRDCIEKDNNLEQDVLDRFDELINQEGKLVRESDKDVFN